MDTNLVPALVADVLQQPGGLPVLSSTLLELWQRRDGRSLRMETYRTLGGISGAVGRVAETVFGRLSPEDQAIARSIFLRLATVGDSGIASRRRIPIGEIDGGRGPDVARVMAVLVDGRLLTVDDGYVEPAHEALLREWPRMREWLDDDAQARRIREHLVASAREWAATGREASELYRGQRLSAALEWASTRGDELNDVERAFLDASREASEAELAGQRRINVRLRGLLGAVAALLVVVPARGHAGAASGGRRSHVWPTTHGRRPTTHGRRRTTPRRPPPTPGSASLERRREPPASRTRPSGASLRSQPQTSCPRTSPRRRCFTRRGRTMPSCSVSQRRMDDRRG